MYERGVAFIMQAFSSLFLNKTSMTTAAEETVNILKLFPPIARHKKKTPSDVLLHLKVVDVVGFSTYPAGVVHAVHAIHAHLTSGTTGKG